MRPNTDPMRPRVALRLPLIATLAAVLVAAQLAPMPASAAEPTPRDIKCQWKKHRKAGRYQACLQDAMVEKVRNALFDLDAAKAACVAAFRTAWELQDANAAALGEVCLDGAGNFDEVRAMLDGPADRLEPWLAGTRWVDNGDGTATDSWTGLQWELKTDDGTVHDRDNKYTWGSFTAPYPPNGTAFTDFIAQLNGSADGVCFAGQCDWRLPTKSDLEGIVDLSVPGCGPGFPGTPCTTIPGFTVNSGYWSSVTYAGLPQLAGQVAYYVSFIDGYAGVEGKGSSFYVRAVRGGS